jgi:hypothetical protein
MTEHRRRFYHGQEPGCFHAERRPAVKETAKSTKIRMA